MEKLKFGIYICLLQPMNKTHFAAIELALSEVDNLIIVLGSAFKAKSIKHPWTFQEREQMLRSCFDTQENNRITVIPIRDYTYNINLWITEVQKNIDSIITDCNSITLYGYNKGKDTNYLKYFPKWGFRDIGNLGDIDPVKIRKAYFTGDLETLIFSVRCNVFKKLQKEINENGIKYQELCYEFKKIEEYKALWKSAPFPPTFVTVDAVIIKSGHILVVRRKGVPGKGLIALPGGFINSDEFIEDSCLRELKEETKIQIPKDELKKRIVESHVFDDPERSTRGRTITHAFFINLGSGELPKVKGSDDAEKAWWMSLQDISKQEDMFFEDHCHIINYFVNKGC